MLAFKVACAGDVTLACSEKVMERVRADSSQVSRCYKLVVAGQNTVLRDDRSAMLELGVVEQPALTVNNQTYRGELSGFDVFKAVCNGFARQPDYCQGGKVWTLLRYDEEEVEQIGQEVAPKQRVLLAIVLVVGLNLGLLLLYRRHQKKKTNEQLQIQVNSAVS